MDLAVQSVSTYPSSSSVGLVCGPFHFLRHLALVIAHSILTDTCFCAFYLDKAFPTHKEAMLFAAGKNPNPNSNPDRFYAVAVGKHPGIYTEWADAQAAYTGVRAPKYKKFDSREAAEEWMRSFAPEFTSFGLEVTPEEDEDGEAEEDEILPPTKKLATGLETPFGEGESSNEVQVIYTDGSTLGNGRDGAVAGIGVYFGDGDRRFVSTTLSQDQEQGHFIY